MIQPDNYSVGGSCPGRFDSGHAANRTVSEPTVDEQQTVDEPTADEPTADGYNVVEVDRHCCRALQIRETTLRSLREWAAAQSPQEAVALLLGRTETAVDGGCDHEGWSLVDRLLTVVDRAIAVRNVHPDPRYSYRVSAEELLEGYREARSVDLEIVGIWHSHPHGSPEPSRRDLAEAWENWSYLISAPKSVALEGSKRDRQMHDPHAPDRSTPADSESCWDHAAWSLVTAERRFESREIRVVDE